jgi:hypothetical protein
MMQVFVGTTMMAHECKDIVRVLCVGGDLWNGWAGVGTLLFFQLAQSLRSLCAATAVRAARVQLREEQGWASSQARARRMTSAAG